MQAHPQTNARVPPQYEQWATQSWAKKNTTSGMWESHTGSCHTLHHSALSVLTTHIQPHTTHQTPGMFQHYAFEDQWHGYSTTCADINCCRWKCHHAMKIVLRHGFVDPHTCMHHVNSQGGGKLLVVIPHMAVRTAAAKDNLSTWTGAP